MKKYLSKWYLYLLAISVSVVAFCLSVTFKTNPKETERVNFFLSTYNAETTKLDNALESKKPSSIKQINITYCSFYSSSFEYIYQTTRKEMDFYILPGSFVNDSEGLYKYYPELDETYLNEYFELTLSYLNLEDKPKAIKIYDHNSKEGFFKDYVTYNSELNEEDFYLLFNGSSPNIGNINLKSTTDHALQIVKELFKL